MLGDERVVLAEIALVLRPAAPAARGFAPTPRTTRTLHSKKLGTPSASEPHLERVPKGTRFATGWYGERMKLAYCSLIGLVLSLSACAEDVCLSQCEEAQTRGCTTIVNCDRYCQALDDVAAASDCGAQREAIDDCADSVDACMIESSCSAQGDRFVACALPYCAASPTPPACITVQSGGGR